MDATSTLVPQFPLLDHVRARRYGVALFGGLALFACCIGLFTFAVDPFQHFRKPSWYEARFYQPLQRHVDPGLARTSGYDTVITGSSMMENYSNADVGRMLNGNAINLAMGAATAYELRHLLTTAIGTGKPRHVIFDLNFNAFSGSPTMQIVSEPLPLHLYDDNPWNDGRYLLHSLTLAKSTEIALGIRRGRSSTNADQPWYWAHEYEFSEKSVLRGLDLADINRTFRQPERTLDGMRASFDANLLPLFRAHPEVRFSLVHPPYSRLVWKDFRQRNQVDVSLAFKRYVSEAVKDLPNVAIYDFQAKREWVSNLDNYKDIYHFNPAISRAMIAAIAAGTDRVDATNVADAEPVLRELADSP